MWNVGGLREDFIVEICLVLDIVQTALDSLPLIFFEHFGPFVGGNVHKYMCDPFLDAIASLGVFG